MKRCPCVVGYTSRGRAPCPHWPPPVEQTDPAARRVAWVLYAFACVIVLGLIAYGCSSCARPPTHEIKAPPPAYGHKVV